MADYLGETPSLREAPMDDLLAFGSACSRILEDLTYVDEARVSTSRDWRSMLQVKCVLSGPHLQLGMVAKDLEAVWPKIAAHKRAFLATSVREGFIELEFLIVEEATFITGCIELRLPARGSRLDR